MVGRNGSPIGEKVQLKDAWITNLGAVDLDMSSNDTPAEVTATITYNYAD